MATKEIWEAATGEILICDDGRDRYAVAVKKSGTIIGHLPRKLSRVCLLFLRRGGTIICTVTGGRRYSADQPQGGLEVPCSLLFFRAFNFRCCLGLRKYFNNELFTNYGSIQYCELIVCTKLW